MTLVKNFGEVDVFLEGDGLMAAEFLIDGADDADFRPKSERKAGQESRYMSCLLK